MFRNLTTLGSVVLGVFLVTFLPFYDHLGQVLSRLFPFKRGLCHAYWAPNFWALYNTLDKILHFFLLKFGITKKKSVASMTGGLVKEFSHEVLPNITPIITLLLTVIVIIPALAKLWTLNKHPSHFLRCLVLCALSSFLFGWHVHEKAILMAIIPLSILAIMDVNDAKIFLILGTVGHYSLFPLLFPHSLLLVKSLLLVLYSIYAFHSLSKVYSHSFHNFSFPLLNIPESLYILGLCTIFSYENFFHYILGLNIKLPYLPLLLTSVYCSLGVVYSWAIFYINFMKRNRYTVNMKPNKKVQ